MAYPQIQTASEWPLDGLILQRMLEHKVRALSKGIILTDDFISAVDNFANRNSLSNIVPQQKGSKEKSIEPCPRCLKAFMISEANKQGLDVSAVKIIENMVPGEVGHHGYYLDNEEVKPVQAEP